MFSFSQATGPSQAAGPKAASGASSFSPSTPQAGFAARYVGGRWNMSKIPITVLCAGRE